MNVHLGEEPVFIGSEVALHTEHDSINVDQGRVQIDAHDDEHVIRVKHDKNDGVDILHAVDRTTDAVTMQIESSGIVRVPDVYYAADGGFESLVDLNGYVNTNIATLAAASATDVGTDALVRRDQALGTEIDNLHVVADSSNYTATFPPAGLYFTEATGRGELNMIEDGRIRFQPYDVDGSALVDRTFAFGRAVPEAGETDVTADARRDGLLLEDATLDQSVELMVSNTLPTLRLIGTKATATSGSHTEPVCPVIDVQDGTEISRFAVYDDGFVVQRGHQDVAPDALNAGHFSSVLAGDESVYIGSCKLSYDRAAKALRFRTLKEAIPVYLAGKGVTAAPVGHTLASMTVHGWVAYARTHQSNERLTVHDVFPPANADWEDATIRTSSTATGTLEDEDGGTIEVDADVFNLSAGCALTRGSDVFTTQALLDAEASTRAAADTTLTNAVNVEKGRVDAILNLSAAELDTFREIELAYKAADSSIETTVTNLTSSAAAARAAIQAGYIAADTVVTNAYVAADSVVTAAQLVITDLLDGRLDTIEGDNATQTELDAAVATATADRLDIRADYIAADTVVTNAHVAADAVVTAAQLVITNLLDGRLDTIEGDNATQTELDAAVATATADRLDIRADYIAADTVVTNAHVAADAVVTAAQLVITDALDGRLDAIEAVDYGTQAELNVEKARIAALEAIDNATQAELNVEKARIAALEAVDNATQVELNVEKARIAALEAIDNATQAELDAQHAAHTSSIAAKQPLLNTTDLYHDSSANRIAIGTATPSSKFHVCYTSASHKGVYFGQGADLDAAHQADFAARTLTLGQRPNGAYSTLGFQVHSTDKAAIDYSNGNMDLVVYDSSSGGWDTALRAQKDGKCTISDLTVDDKLTASGQIFVSLANLPTSDPGVAGQLWRSGNVNLKISLG